ncbi:hypothetical protein ISS03_03910 [Patescibacteria group bacterium]|nr:hypothetical protein [Patescibacteria group bacterium]
MIRIKRTTRFSKITIVEYAKYQTVKHNLEHKNSDDNPHRIEEFDYVDGEACTPSGTQAGSKRERYKNSKIEKNNNKVSKKQENYPQSYPQKANKSSINRGMETFSDIAKRAYKNLKGAKQ